MSKVTKQVCLYSEACDLLTANACDNGDVCQIRDPEQGLATCRASEWRFDHARRALAMYFVLISTSPRRAYPRSASGSPVR